MIGLESPSSEEISLEFIETICARLAQGKKVKSALPLGGRLHIDRPLPFLCVYRYPTKYHDAGTEQLVLGEASHLIVKEAPRLKESLSLLIKHISATLAEKFGAFLILEIWAATNQTSAALTVSPAP